MTEDPHLHRRDELLLATLPHVAFDGWSLAALKAGAADCGGSLAEAQRLFPGGIGDLLAHFAHWSDRRMETELAKRDMKAMKIRERIACAVRTRLEIWAPHKEAVRRAMLLSAFPNFAPLALTALYRAVDSMWYAAGDNATDFNFYTKRLLLSGVYGSTLVYWLDDKSDGHAETWAFLDRRIANVMEIPKIKGRVKEAFARVPNPFAIAEAARSRVKRRFGAGV